MSVNLPPPKVNPNAPDAIDCNHRRLVDITYRLRVECVRWLCNVPAKTVHV